MRKRKTKVFALLLSLALILTAFPASVFAENILAAGTCGENTTYHLTENGMLTIYGNGNIQDSMGWPFDERLVTNIVIQSEVKEIGVSAFSNFVNLTTVEVKGNTIIGAGAFSYCKNLRTVSMPEVVQIKNGAFTNDDALAEITAPKVESLGDMTFGWNYALTTVNFPKVTSVGKSAFYGCDKLTSVFLPKLTEIPHMTFQECTSLKTIIAPEVQNIGENAFALCHALEKADFPKVLSVDDNAFLKCYALTSVNLPLVKDAGMDSFADCKALTELNLPELENAKSRFINNCVSLKRLSLPKLQDPKNAFTLIETCSQLNYLFIPRVKTLQAVFSSELNEVVLSVDCAILGQFSPETTVHLLMNDINDPFESFLTELALKETKLHKVPKNAVLSVANGYDTYKCSKPNCNFSYSDTMSVTPVHSLQLIQTSKGTITSDREEHKVMDHGSIKFTFTPESGYYLKNIVIDGEKKTAAKTYTLKDVTKPHTISAVFEITPEKLIQGVKNTRIIYPKAYKYKKGIKVTWKKTSGYRMDGYQVWRSTSKNSGYKKMIEKTTTSYINTASLKKGRTYWYKIRGYRVIDGKRYYTAYRTISIKY